MENFPLDLGDRHLWPDGEFTVDPDRVADYIFKLSSSGLSKLKVNEMTREVQSYNSIADVPITVKESFDTSIFPPNWSIPQEYLDLDIDEYLYGLVDKVSRDSLYEARVRRLSEEIFLFKEMGLESILRTLIYVVDTMVDRKIVWGVGRGSSCSSYLLYVIGLHSIDCVKYDIPVSDFLRL